MYNGDEIKENIISRQLNILKGFVEVDNIIKARNVGDVHSSGKYVWTQLANGKFDWRTRKATPTKTESSQKTDDKPKHNLKLDGTDNSDDVLAEHSKGNISSDHVRVHYAHQVMKQKSDEDHDAKVKQAKAVIRKLNKLTPGLEQKYEQAKYAYNQEYRDQNNKGSVARSYHHADRVLLPLAEQASKNLKAHNQKIRDLEDSIKKKV